ncbi:MAG: response regulator [Acetobacteraceae bacterium]|nr:response regulator [Acetobacteraceae bacterium]
MHRILLAEPDALVAAAHADALEAAGFAAMVAGNGVAALEAASRMLHESGGGPDALVTALRMPFLGGEGVIHALRGLWPDLPVVVTSGDPKVGAAEALRRRSQGHGPLVLFGQSLAAGGSPVKRPCIDVHRYDEATA